MIFQIFPQNSVFDKKIRLPKDNLWILLKKINFKKNQNIRQLVNCTNVTMELRRWVISTPLLIESLFYTWNISWQHCLYLGILGYICLPNIEFVSSINLLYCVKRQWIKDYIFHVKQLNLSQKCDNHSEPRASSKKRPSKPKVNSWNCSRRWVKWGKYSFSKTFVVGMGTILYPDSHNKWRRLYDLLG